MVPGVAHDGMGAPSFLKRSPLVITAPATRASLLAIATVTRRVGRRSRRPLIQCDFAVSFLRA